jgi:hypothetical protein
MKAAIQNFIHNLIIYDYFLFGGIILLFILLLFLAIVLRQHMRWAIFFVVLAFGVLTVAPVAGYIALHHYLFKHTLVIHEVKALEYTKALLIKGDINNTSKRTFKECTLHAGVFKVSHNKYIDPVYPYIPFKKGSLRVKMDIRPGESAPFKLFVEPFRYTKDYNVTLKAECR